MLNVNIGTEAVNIGTEAVNIGTEATEKGTEANNIGTEAPNIGKGPHGKHLAQARRPAARLAERRNVGTRSMKVTRGHTGNNSHKLGGQLRGS